MLLMHEFHKKKYIYPDKFYNNNQKNNKFVEEGNLEEEIKVNNKK